MMKILIGTTELEVINCYAYRYQNGKLVLKIELDQTVIAHDELKTLLKENTGDIVKITEKGVVTEVEGSDPITTVTEMKETYSGFSYTLSITDKEEKYFVELECISETERKLGDVQNELATQKELNASLSNEITNNQLALVEQYEANLALEEQVTNLHLALAEVYESTISD